MKKGFTLVEMLIVVVIIGILSAALLPRLQGAQASARDTARKADIATLGTAIVSYFNQKGTYPCSGNCAGMTGADAIGELLKKQVDLSSLPADPTKGNIVYGFKDTDLSVLDRAVAPGQYGYQIVTKNGISSGGFILMARPETEGGANFASGYKIKSGDISNFRACTSFTQGTAPGGIEVPTSGACTYVEKADLRYVYIF